MWLDNCRELEWACQTTSQCQNDSLEMTGNAEILRISEKTRYFRVQNCCGSFKKTAKFSRSQNHIGMYRVGWCSA